MKRSSALPPLLVLCVALQFYAEGAFYLLLGDYARMSRASAGRSLHAVNAAL